MYRAYTDKDSSLFKDASKEFMLSVVELSSYAYMTNLLLPAITQGVASMFGLRDDEEEESKGSVGREIGTQVIVDMIPVPTGNAVTNIIKEGLNRAVFYPYDRMTEGDFALGEDGFWGKDTTGGTELVRALRFGEELRGAMPLRRLYSIPAHTVTSC